MDNPLLNSLPKLPDSGFTGVSLFSGGGLLDLGATHAGLRIVWANDLDTAPCIAYAHNLGDHITRGNITERSVQGLIPNGDIFIGGPPCQDFSVAGSGAGEEGERGKLVWTYLTIIKRKQPRAFLFENVKGLTTKRHIKTLEALITEFDRIGYAVAWQVLNAWDFGVAQKRERVFIVGVRKDYGFSYEFPESEYSLTGYHPVVYDAISDLPEPTINHNPKPLSEGAPYGLVYPENHDGHLFDNVGNNPTWDHANRVAPWDKPAPTRTEKDRCDGIHPGPLNHERKDISDKALEGYARRAGQGGFGYRVNEWDSPSPTVFGRIANEGKAFVHPNTEPRPRRFTVRECLRLQSVPDSYVFPDSMSLSAMYKVVGNGVPSRMAYHLIKALISQLKSHVSILD